LQHSLSLLHVSPEARHSLLAPQMQPVSPAAHGVPAGLAQLAEQQSSAVAHGSPTLVQVVGGASQVPPAPQNSEQQSVLVVHVLPFAPHAAAQAPPLQLPEQQSAPAVQVHPIG